MPSPRSPAPASVINPDYPMNQALSFPHLSKLEPNTVSMAGFWLESRERVLRTFQQVQAYFLSRTNQSISLKNNKKLTHLHLKQL